MTDHVHARHRDGKERSTAILDVSGLLWASEQNVVAARLGRCPGVLEVEVNPVAQTATVLFDPALTSLAELRASVIECGYHCAGQSVPAHICDPMDEPDPPPAVHGGAGTPPAPYDTMEHDGAEAPPSPHDTGHGGAETPPAPHDTMEHEGAEAPPSSHDAMDHGGHAGMSMAAMVADMRNRFLVALLFSIPIVMWSPIGTEVLGLDLPVPFGLRPDMWALLLSLPVIFYSCRLFFSGAVRALRARTLDMMVLVSVAVGAGWLYSLIVTLTGGGEVFYEASTVLAAFVLLGHWFEMRARGGANDAIRTLLDLAPPRAVVIRGDALVEVPTAEVVTGDLLLVRPGAKIPVDGVVEDGDSEVDESVVTGESLPVHKQPASAVIGATINRNGTLRVRATKVGADAALAQIVKLVQQAQNSKAPGQRLADRAAFWLVLVALAGGGITFVAWFLLAGQPFSVAILFAITFVVIACPDALVLATPTAIMVGAGLGAERGILFKNAIALETSARVQVVVMDKTGTLTKGEPEVTDVITDGVAEDEVMRLVAAVERESEHPLAEAVVRHVDARGSDALRAGRFENVPGHGAVAEVAGHRVMVGNRRLLEREGVELGKLGVRRDEVAAGGRTAIMVAIDGTAAAVIGIADAPRPTSAAAVAALHELGLEVVMLTGDNAATARRIADQLGIDTVIAEVLPGDKAARIIELQTGGRKVAMVGDGVNDAPALAQADLGIAVGAGTDVAIETADVVLMRSDLLDVPTALRIGRGTLRKMRQNLGWAIGYNTIALPIAAGVFEPAFGLVLRPEIAALSMSGSSIIVAVNALALKLTRLPSPAGATSKGETRA
ncbi:cation-translocating P-type ATPase [Streptosporangium sp. 'caverna']|uniref:heavy metal translocating P-type ATPase n=1 Tax=Streptosporangium sp. 'caverna' TaxID=2202249 RepID=UPI000D7E8885|nr:heavy metal translocating P-type ATPase [Streptosporangium sp. 'caverna']AWS45330.1 ATPase P [Streptosporangium sp. 'caverna']